MKKKSKGTPEGEKNLCKSEASKKGYFFTMAGVPMRFGGQE